MQKRIYIVGAHSRAQTLAVYLQYLYPDVIIEAYLYDNSEKNPSNIEGVEVARIDGNKKLQTDYPVYIGTRGVYHKKIEERLKRYGFINIIPVTAEFDLKIRNEYLKKYYKDIGRKFLKIDTLDSVRGEDNFIQTVKSIPNENISAKIYVVKSAFDKPLQQSYMLAPYEQEIQAGAALTEIRLPGVMLKDNVGDNISDKNRQFCELTALYWIWKHAKENIVGLAHYRRHFIMPEDWVEKMEAHNIDVILPIPLCVVPNLEKNYKKRHDPSDWEYMLQCLKEEDPQMGEAADIFFKGSLYSPCNMFVMRKEVLGEMCTWLFSILFKIAEHGGEKEDSYLNRYPGFISERLMTFFFEERRERYKIIYSDKSFLL